MNNYLKTSLALSVYLASVIAHADYQVNYILDKKDINFTNTPVVVGEWLSTTPSYSEWTYVGDYFDCQSALPTIETQDEGVQFTQTLADCSRNRTRSVQQREQNDQTHAYRDVGASVDENENEKNLTYTQQLTGTSPAFTLNFGAGRYTTTGNTLVGSYARTNSGISIGDTILNENGARVLLYFTSFSQYPVLQTCMLRYGITSTTGWTPGGITPPTAYDDVQKYNYIDLYNGSTLYKRYSLSGSNVNSAETGYYRDISVACSDMVAFYNNTSFFSKAVFRKN
jgi:hypothetical protein